MPKLKWELSRDSHGGECCGVTHIYGFAPDPSYQDAAGSIDRAIDRLWRQNFGFGEDPWQGQEDDGKSFPFNHVIEVILTDTQMLHWAATMKEKGFVLAGRYFNSNSGNYINILHYQTNPPDEEAEPPYNW